MSDHQPPAKKRRFDPGFSVFYLDNSVLADVRFLFQSNDGTVKRIPAHKFALAAASDVFGRMFTSEMGEAGEVKIVDASEADFKEFLKIFYEVELDLTGENVAQVLYLGDKYNIENCVNDCVQFLERNLTNENVCTVLSLAILFGHKQMIESCEKRILVNTEEIFKTADYLDCSKEVVAHILDMKLLSCSEVDVFEACMAWVRAKSKQNTVSKAMVENYLGDLYYKVRFESMTLKEVCDLATKYNDVLRDDFQNIGRLIAQPARSPRQAEWKKDAIIRCNRDDSDSMPFLNWYELWPEEMVTFSTNQPLLLGHIYCNVPFMNEAEQMTNLIANVRVTERSSTDGTNEKILFENAKNLVSRYQKLSLPNPLLIRPGFWYTVQISELPQRIYFQSPEQQSIIHLGDDIEIKFHNDRLDAEGRKIGLIWHLVFNKV